MQALRLARQVAELPGGEKEDAGQPGHPDVKPDFPEILDSVGILAQLGSQDLHQKFKEIENPDTEDDLQDDENR